MKNNNFLKINYNINLKIELYSYKTFYEYNIIYKSNKMNKMNKLVCKFEPSYIGNGWGNYVDIENYKYDNINSLPLIQTNKYYYYDNTYNYNYNYNDYNDNTNVNVNVNTDKKTYNAVTNLIIKVSSTTFVTLLISYFVYNTI